MYKLEGYYADEVTLEVDITDKPANIGGGILQCTVVSETITDMPEEIFVTTSS